MTVRQRIGGVARRHPGVVLLAMPCSVAAVVVLTLWPSGGVPRADRAAALTGVMPVAQHRPAPDFNRPPVTGHGRVSLRGPQRDVVVVSFWASWCAACKSEAGQLRDLAARERAHGVRFLGIDQEDTRAAARAFLASSRPGYPNAYDPDGGLLRAYGGIGLPSTFIVDRRGDIRFQAIGAFRVGAFQAALDKVVAD